MTVMYSFCFWFSVRLGCIIVGVISLLQAVVGLVFMCMGLDDPASVSEKIETWIESYELLSFADILRSVKEDPYSYLLSSVILLSSYSASCILLIIGALKINLWLVYPFIGLDLLRVLFMSVTFIIFMMILKENILDLGMIIGVSLAGGFTLLYLYYLWFCSVSLCQMVREMRKSEAVKPSSVGDPRKYVHQPRARKMITSLGLDDRNSHPNRPLYGVARPVY